MFWKKLIRFIQNMLTYTQKSQDWLFWGREMLSPSAEYIRSFFGTSLKPWSVHTQVRNGSQTRKQMVILQVII